MMKRYNREMKTGSWRGPFRPLPKIRNFNFENSCLNRGSVMVVRMLTARSVRWKFFNKVDVSEEYYN